MSARARLILSAIVVILFIVEAGCSKQGTDTSALYIPTAADATATATLQELQQGRALYVDYCGKCHGFYNPDAFSPTQWRNVMTSMAPKTSMTAGEVNLVTKYVTRGN
jgi:hypothetical protein